MPTLIRHPDESRKSSRARLQAIRRPDCRLRDDRGAPLNAFKPASDSGVRRPATLTKIGGLAGVSVATVSKVLHRRPGVAPDTRRRVEALLNAHGYVVADDRNAGRTQTTVVDVAMTVLHDPWAARMIAAFEHAAASRGLDIVPAPTSPTLGDEPISRILSRGSRGLISVFADPTPAQEHRLAGHGLPLVVVGGNGTEASSTRVVAIDYRAGAHAATEHLIELGHRRIGLVLGDRRKRFNQERLIGYHEALQAHGLGGGAVVRWADSFAVEDGCAQTRVLLDLPDRPTAIIAANDNLAIGVYRAIEGAGLAVGSDISVIGFDNRPEADWLRPGLTTLEIPLGRLAEAAFDQLLRDDAANDVEGPATVTPELVHRASVVRLGLSI